MSDTLTQQVDVVVARGAAWLDEHRPGWYLEIDVANLDLQNCNHCVLGQVGTAILEEHGMAPVKEMNGYVAIMDMAEKPRNPDWVDPSAACIRTALSLVEDDRFDEFALGFNRAGTTFTWADLDDAWIRAIKERIG